MRGLSISPVLQEGHPALVSSPLFSVQAAMNRAQGLFFLVACNRLACHLCLNQPTVIMCVRMSLTDSEYKERVWEVEMEK